MTMVYEPSRHIGARISRRLVTLQSRRDIRFNLERPIISFTFDDCPKSAINNGVSQIDKEGWLCTAYVSGGLMGITNHHGLQIQGEDAQALHKSGHEVGCHTFSHIDAQSHALSDFLADIDRNREYYDGFNLPEFETFAYPYGQTTAPLKTALETRFLGLRGIESGPHVKKSDLNQIKSTAAFTGTKMERTLAQIMQLKTRPAWLTIFTHDVRDNHSRWGCSPKDMEDVIMAVKNSGAEVLTVAKAIKRLGAVA